MSRRHLIRPLIAGALALALVPLSALPAGAAPAGPWIPGVLAQGVLTDSTGNPQPGEEVRLVAWPAASSLAALATGAEVATEVVATATTGVDGSFSFARSARFEDRLRPFASDQSVVDLTVESDAGGEFHTYSFSRIISTGTEASGDEDPPVQLDTSDIVLEGYPQSDVVDGTAPSTTTQGPGGCIVTKIATLGPRWVAVGSTWNTQGSTATFTYKAGATSEIGVGVSVGDGAFKADGTSSVSSSATITFPPITGTLGRIWRTQFVFAKFRQQCPIYNGTRVYVKAIGFAGGTVNGATTVVPTATFCTPYLATAKLKLETTNATKLSNAAQVTSDIGISLSARSGYSTQVSVTYAFTASRHACGERAYPGDQTTGPGRVVIKP